MENQLKNLYLSQRQVLKDIIPLKLPLCISIEPSNLCNFKCSMCFHGNNEDDPAAKPLKNMDWEVFCKTVSDIKQWTGKYNTKIKLMKLYSLGEPLVNTRTADMIREIKKANICEKIEITTNGSLLSQEVAEAIVDSGLDILRISVYSMYPDRMKKITHSSVLPDKILSNIRYLKEYRDKIGRSNPKIYIKMFETGTNEDKVFVDTFTGIADEIGFDQVFQMDLGGANAFSNIYDEKAEFAHQHSLETNKIHKIERRACRYPFTHITVRSDGKCVVCCADWRKELSLGNVCENTLEEIWNSKTLYELRCNMLKTRGDMWQACRQCEIPYRDSEEDNVNDVSLEVLNYLYDI